MSGTGSEPRAPTWLAYIHRLFARIATTEVCPGVLIAALVLLLLELLPLLLLLLLAGGAPFLATLPMALGAGDQSATIARAIGEALTFAHALASRSLGSPSTGLTTLRAASVAFQQSCRNNDDDAIALAAPFPIGKRLPCG